MEELSVSQAHVEFQKQQQQVGRNSCWKILWSEQRFNWTRKRAMTIPNGQEKSQNNRYSSGNCIHYHPEHNL